MKMTADLVTERFVKYAIKTGGLGVIKRANIQVDFQHPNADPANGVPCVVSFFEEEYGDSIFFQYLPAQNTFQAISEF